MELGQALQGWNEYVTALLQQGANEDTLSVSRTWYNKLAEEVRVTQYELDSKVYENTIYVQTRMLHLRQCKLLQDELTRFAKIKPKAMSGDEDTVPMLVAFFEQWITPSYGNFFQSASALHDIEYSLQRMKGVVRRSPLRQDLLDRLSSLAHTIDEQKKAHERTFATVLPHAKRKVPAGYVPYLDTVTQLFVFEPFEALQLYVRRHHPSVKGAFFGLEDVSATQVLHALYQLGVDLSRERFDLDAVVQGATVEMEHTQDPTVAVRIALDHLRERADYYRQLAAWERRGRRS